MPTSLFPITNPRHCPALTAAPHRHCQEANFGEIFQSIDLTWEFIVNIRAMLATMQVRPLGELLQARTRERANIQKYLNNIYIRKRKLTSLSLL